MYEASCYSSENENKMVEICFMKNFFYTMQHMHNDSQIAYADICLFEVLSLLKKVDNLNNVERNFSKISQRRN